MDAGIQETISVDDATPEPGFSLAWEDAGIFVRDRDGRLVQFDDATAEDLDRRVKVTIDGYELEVPKAVLKTDELGVPIKRVRPEDEGAADDPGAPEVYEVRATTIHDVARQLADKLNRRRLGEEDDIPVTILKGPEMAAGGDGWDWREKGNPIPILCHQEYMEPVAVCRACVVQVKEIDGKTGELKTLTKLFPACQYRVAAGMVVDTAESPAVEARKKVRAAVGTLVDLMMSDHPSPCVKERRKAGDCELEALARRLGIASPKFARRAAELPRDDSSLVIAFDPNACILCDRCVRGCDTIKENHVIGRMGKGYTAQIAFDLGDSMGSSSCVACGECVDSCPTGALTTLQVQLPQSGTTAGGGPTPPTGLARLLDWFKPEARKPARRQLAFTGEEVTVEQLINHPEPKIREAFRGLSREFLRKNIQAVVRRRFREGEFICKQGEYGKTAFMIEQGRVQVLLETEMGHVTNRERSGIFGPTGRFDSEVVSRDAGPRRQDGRDAEDMRDSIPIDAPASASYRNALAELLPGDLFGEMSCMNHYPRSATAVASADGTVVLEMLRNVLYIMQRNSSFRHDLEADYRKRAVENLIRTNKYFEPLRNKPDFEAFVKQLTARSELRHCEPGEQIIRQGTPPRDGFYIVRTGFVKVTQAHPGGEIVLNYQGPQECLGEMALLAEMDDLPDVRALKLEPIRSATCSALDHVELVWIRREVFREIVRAHPEIRERLVHEARKRIDANRRRAETFEISPLDEFLENGLMNANHLLVLDLEKCTRCDECTKACSDTHGGVTRLIRDGLRFDKFLVASSCRSCLDPYCLVGCPVGSITRNPTGEILIADWCIGCGLCAENCPYGNINMVGEDTWIDDNRLVTIGGLPQKPAETRKVKAKVYKATTCDFCTSLGPNREPSCVYACPHDAAHRYSGDELLKIIRRDPA